MIRSSRTLFTVLLAALALLAAPGLARAEYLVPEGNSAVTQYTEGFPTGGGEKKAEGSKGVKPGRAIGAGNAKKLEQHSPEGKAVAEVAAETAPAPAPTSEAAEPAPQHAKEQGQKQSSQQQKQSTGKEQGDEKRSEDATAPVASGGEGPSGSSGAGEVLGAATGLSSGSIGLLLPLIVLAAIVWGLYYAWRQRQRHSPPEPSRP